MGSAEERSFALTTRLTMLTKDLARREGQSGLADSKLNFVSFDAYVGQNGVVSQSGEPQPTCYQ